MIRIISSVDFAALFSNQGWGDEKLSRVLKHGQVTVRNAPTDEDGNPVGPTTVLYDILLDRDSDLPPGVIVMLLNNPKVVYAAEWDMKNSSGMVLKGSDPGYHKFAGWPV